MNGSRRFRLGVLLLLVLPLAPCGDPSGNDRPVSGWLALRLSSPNADDGGVLITVTGATIDSMRTIHPQLLTLRESATSIRAVIGGNLSTGTIAEILVPDTRQAARYSATIQEVAARTTFQQRALTGYTLSVIAPAR
jgi:hypothetical protein